MSGTSAFRTFIVIVSLFLTAAPLSPAGAPKKLTDLSGFWSAQFWGGSEFRLTQEGNRVWGKFKYGKGEGFARGSWIEERLILVLTPTTAESGGTCDPRKILVVASKEKATALEAYALDLANQQSAVGKLFRKSAHPGPSIEYPYEAELKNCGALPTYDLSLEANSDQEEADSPILEIVADMLNRQPRLAIEIAVHTDSTGKEDVNQKRSEQRASVLRNLLIRRYGADARRLAASGYGQEQPLADNGTEQGRAINRRIEFVQLH